MGEIKTKPTKASVVKFIDAIEHPRKKEEAKIVLELFKKITKEKPVMWGTSIIGFGKFHYKSKSGQEGDWMMTGFSPRKQKFSFYIMAGFTKKQDLLKKLGKHKTGVGCLYINKLADIDMEVLEQLIKGSYEQMKKNPSFC